jgi:hypothetical protein
MTEPATAGTSPDTSASKGNKKKKSKKTNPNENDDFIWQVAPPEIEQKFVKGVG